MVTEEQDSVNNMKIEEIIQIKELTKTFISRNTALVALENITLNIKESNFVSIVGPSGCGKSTLLMMIAGLRLPSKGEVLINGKKIDKPYTNLGIVFQRDTLLEWRTVLANVMLPVQIRGLERNLYLKRAYSLLEAVGLSGFQNYFPRQLSGGMRQRVAICRALVHDPPMLMMDEPFGALDALTRDLMSEELQRIWMQNRKTALFVTHSITEAVFLSDEIVIMSPRPGRIIKKVVINLPRPRTLSMAGTSEFSSYVNSIRDTLEQSGAFAR